MAFFKKLKDKLFKSSSKLDEGLEAIVSDGGEEELVSAEAPEERPAPPQETPAPDTPETPAPDLPEETPPEPEPEITPDPDPEPIPEPEPIPDPETPSTPQPDLPPGPTPGDTIPGPGPVEIPQPEAPAGIPSGPGPQEIPGSPAPIEMPVSPTPQEIPTNPGRMELSNTDVAEVARAAPAAKPGFIGRILGRGVEQKVVVRRVLDDDMLESLEELLIASDMGVDTALRVTANLAEGRYGRKMSVDEIKRALADEIARVMEPVARPMPIYPKTPQVVLVVGVNGSGKTTTIGKLASQFKAAGKDVVIAAGDTFRAAAVEQLKVWGDRAGVPVLTAPEGSDPASLAFDAMTKAQADGADLLMIDTAGRLQNRADLMEELAKIVRVIRKKDPDAPHNTILVLDATTGQNALSQVETFRKLADVSGLVMTKLDGTAKGGVLVALADKFGLPIHAIGVGEQIDDLAPFDPQEFAEALTGIEG
ncbi:signal recognition particle-docking protein FtsY [Mesobacterium pallidum]|uniref:signal recognition particle-docking protein FtsY n=1 Tax=Mesobacterium pallidum TaxID=2872037 RepID=UPI001EE22D0A|nr:signal recognition particle-docking protein FtsY [Mesobacterium pallidum]